MCFEKEPQISEGDFQDTVTVRLSLLMHALSMLAGAFIAKATEEYRNDMNKIYLNTTVVISYNGIIVQKLL